MDLYHVVLFLHIVTLLVAAGATAVTKLAVGRRTSARTVAEALDWHNVLMAASKLFPMCLVAFVLTGSYMLGVGHIAWSTGFVVAGLFGVLSLLVSGVFLATKGKALKQMLDGLAKTGENQPAPKLVPPRLVAALPLINTGIALAVAFDMVAKPVSVPIALSVVVAGIVIGGVLGIRNPSPVGQGVRAS